MIYKQTIQLTYSLSEITVIWEKGELNKNTVLKLNRGSSMSALMPPDMGSYCGKDLQNGFRGPCRSPHLNPIVIRTYTIHKDS